MLLICGLSDERLSVQLTFAQSEVEALVADEKESPAIAIPLRQIPQELDWKP